LPGGQKRNDGGGSKLLRDPRETEADGWVKAKCGKINKNNAVSVEGAERDIARLKQRGDERNDPNMWPN